MINTRTSSNGLVSLKQLFQISLTARSVDVVPGHAGFAQTERTARRRTYAYGHGHGHGNRVYLIILATNCVIEFGPKQGVSDVSKSIGPMFCTFGLCHYRVLSIIK